MPSSRRRVSEWGNGVQLVSQGIGAYAGEDLVGFPNVEVQGSG